MRRALLLMLAAAVLLQAVPAVHAEGLWDVLQRIPLIQQKFYVDDIIKLAIYICGLLLAVGVLLVVAGYAIAGERPTEGATLLARGKKMIKAGILGLVLAGVLPPLVRWFSSQVTPEEKLPEDVPLWST